MQNPKSTTTAEGQHPDTYHGQFWSNIGEPHTNSTVLSHWFYLLSQGGSGTNDLQNSYSITGIGIDDAQLIAFRAESMYLNSSATYADARNATIQAARDLFGSCSTQEITVTNAWYAVGIGTAITPITTATITALKTSALGEPTTYRFTATPYLGATYTWYVSGALSNPQQSGPENTFDWYFPCRNTRTVYCIASNACTSATSNSISKTGECSRTAAYTLSPNPADNTVTVSSTNAGNMETTAAIDDVRIYDLQGNLKKQQKFGKAKTATINIAGLRSGTYFIEIVDGEYKEKLQLLIQH